MRSLGQLQCDGARIVSQTRAEEVFLLSDLPAPDRKWFQPEWKPTALSAGRHRDNPTIYQFMQSFNEPWHKAIGRHKISSCRSSERSWKRACRLLAGLGIVEQKRRDLLVLPLSVFGRATIPLPYGAHP